MARNQSKLIAYFMTLTMLAGIWAPFAASAMMTTDHQMEHKHSSGASVVAPVSYLMASGENTSLNNEPVCNTCDGAMGDHNNNCSDSCCQSCVNCSSAATIISVPVFPALHISVQPILPIATNLSVNLQLLERPPRDI